MEKANRRAGHVKQPLSAPTSSYKSIEKLAIPTGLRPTIVAQNIPKNREYSGQYEDVGWNKSLLRLELKRYEQ